MKIHITNIYGMAGAAADCQHMAADIAKKYLGFDELGIYHYSMDSESQEMLHARLDGIMASVSFGEEDIVILQLPTWNGIAFDEVFVRKLNAYRKIKMIFFIHDVTPLMFEENRYLLRRYVDLYNQADLIILPSKAMCDFLRTEGLTVQKVVVQRMWDCIVSLDDVVPPRFGKIFNFASDVNQKKFSFVKEWKYDDVRLAVTARAGAWEHGANVELLGWFHNDHLLANALRKSGGFGLVWTEDFLCREYMKLNANYKLSLYLAAGLPVAVHKSIPEAGLVFRENLGITADSLDGAVEKTQNMDEKAYHQMAENVGRFGNLLREGYFTKKALTDAVFELLYS